MKADDDFRKLALLSYQTRDERSGFFCAHALTRSSNSTLPSDPGAPRFFLPATQADF
jgi:hypothetical protein